MSRLLRFSWICLVFNLSGCGYTLMRTQNPLAEKLGVKKLYVAAFQNESPHSGVETIVRSQVIKTIKGDGRIQIINDKDFADAVLDGIVTSAGFQPSGTAGVSGVYPSNLYVGQGVPQADTRQGVAASYSASLSFSISIRRHKEISNLKPRATLWSGAYSRGESFPATNQLGPFGTTSSLINYSDFERAIRELAEASMLDVQESMLALF